MTETYSASELQSYPGGPAAWIRAMSAKSNREANRQGLKSTARGGGNGLDGQSAARGSKRAGAGGIGRAGNTPGVPNQTEQRYRDNFLVPRILAGEIVECVFEGRTFELAHRCTYTPDWCCRLADGTTECHEVKGPHVFGDSRIKFKWAKDKFRNVKWVWAQWRGGKWHVKESA